MRRRNYQIQDAFSKQIGQLINCKVTEENEGIFKDLYNRLCQFDGHEHELSIGSFIEITTQQYMNINSNLVVQKIIHSDEDKNGLIEYAEFLNLLEVLS